jgi:hypothetical protein
LTNVILVAVNKRNKKKEAHRTVPRVSPIVNYFDGLSCNRNMYFERKLLDQKKKESRSPPVFDPHFLAYYWSRQQALASHWLEKVVNSIRTLLI